MKILRLLNNKIFVSVLIFITFVFKTTLYTEEKPVDIWNVDETKKDQSLDDNKILETNNNIDTNNETDIYNLQTDDKILEIKLDEVLESKEVKIVGLYDPEDYGLDINMWSESDGEQLKNLFSNINKIDLSDDAAEIMNISILTNSYYPEKNISEEEFLKYKSQWLIKNSDLALIEEYLIKNQIINKHPILTKFLVNEYLSQSNLDKACEFFSKNVKPLSDEYLIKFNIYCLVNEKKEEEAKLILDLKKELGFKDEYFEKKINFLFGYDKELDKTISEKSILDFHLAHRTNPEFFFEPNNSTSKMIWKYLSSSNLLYDTQKFDMTELDKISTIEKAVHNRNYPEKDLYEIYKRFQFNINQLLNAKDSYKSLSLIEGRALLYQKILLESETGKKLDLISTLKESFKKENINNAFDNELRNLLEDINPSAVPSNFTRFYQNNIKKSENENKKIKFNNDILHQSKLVNYFNGDYAKSKIEKDVNNFLKKIKKNKKYFFSKKDVIFLESLKSDGIQISKKYDDLYEIDQNEIPSDIQLMISNEELGAALLRIVQVIGQDDVDIIDADTMYFIISTLNQLNVDFIRNKILLKVLPLKV